MAFQTGRSLLPEATEGVGDVYVRDLDAGTVRLGSSAADGAEPNSASFFSGCSKVMFRFTTDSLTATFVPRVNYDSEPRPRRGCEWVPLVGPCVIMGEENYRLIKADCRGGPSPITAAPAGYETSSRPYS